MTHPSPRRTARPSPAPRSTRARTQHPLWHVTALPIRYQRTPGVEQDLFALGRGQSRHQHASDGVRDVVLPASGMVNRVPFASGSPPLEVRDLLSKSCVIQKFDFGAIDRSHELDVDVALSVPFGV